MTQIELTVNGARVRADVEDGALLLDVLREEAGCVSVREGCGVGVCGACTAIVNGEPVSTCLELAARHDGSEVVTVEGLAPGDAVQESFVQAGAMQCGYCTPGFVLMVYSLLRSHPEPSDAQITAHLAANTCRCGAYLELEDAVRLAIGRRSAAHGRARDGDVPVRDGLQRLAVTRRGGGEPVVLLHSLAMAGRMWDEPADRLADGFEVYSYDARGHGASTGEAGPFSVEDMAGDLAELLDALGLQTTSLVGLSMGGSVAIVFAALFPERVDRLMLADTTACYGPDRLESWEQRARTALEQPRAQQVPFQLDRWFTPDFRERDPATVERMADIFTACDSRVHAEACRALGRLDATPLLDRISAPTLVLVGEDDFATPPPMAETLATGIAGAQLSVIPDARHMALIERAELWNEVRTFLSESRAAAPSR